MLKWLWVVCLLFFIAPSFAADTTHRTYLLDNAQVKVWITTINPNDDLRMHRHEHPRVVFAFDDGKLEVVNDKKEKHFLVFEKDHAYYLDKDKPKEMHTDANLSGHPIKVMVIELKQA